MTIVIILGGIMGGIVTPTEAAVTAVAYTFLLGMFFYRKLTLSIIPRLMIETIRINGMVMLMLATATLFSWIITSQEVPKMIGDFLMKTIENPLLLLLVFNVVLLFAGAILDLTPAMIIFVPVLAPIAGYVGVDPIHFGVIVVMNLGIGLFTPPVGGVLFVCCSIAEINMKDVFRGFVPYFLGMIAALLVITYVPSISLWLPNLFQ
jgi:C4-dicarboxylate transporter DctM subunit